MTTAVTAAASAFAQQPTCKMCPGTYIPNEEVQAYIDYGNDVLRKSGRGYQMSLTEIANVANASRWFNINAAGDGDDTDKKGDPAELEKEVKDSFNSGVNKFLFRDNAINIYIVGSNTQGSCSCGPNQDSDIIVLSQNINPDWVILHESGHFLDLPHTHDGEQAAGGATACVNLNPGNDGIKDTLPEHSCWNFNQLSINNPNATTTQLNNTFFNIMAKHGSTPGFRTVLTSDQLDVMADASNGHRSEVTNGKTIFVDEAALGLVPTGNSGAPHKQLKNGIDDTGAADIVLMRTGSYILKDPLTKAVTLRASRGDATIRAN
jgi:hypothetical protein